MVYSIVEDIAEAYYKSKEYFTIRDFPYKVQNEEKKQWGWSDIDVLAYNHKEVVIISCKHFLHRRNINKEIKHFKDAENEIKAISKDNKNKYKLFQKKKIKKVLIVEFWNQPPKYDKKLNENGIERPEFKGILDDLYTRAARDYIKNNHYVGKETNAICRLFISLYSTQFDTKGQEKEIYKIKTKKLKNEISEACEKFKKKKMSKRKFNEILERNYIKDLGVGDKRDIKLKREDKEKIYNIWIG